MSRYDTKYCERCMKYTERVTVDGKDLCANYETHDERLNFNRPFHADFQPKDTVAERREF